MSHPDSIDPQEHAQGTLLNDTASEPSSRHDTMTRILKSQLIASGVQKGGKTAFIIPADMFVSGEVDWKKSTLTHAEAVFIDVRLRPESPQKAPKTKGKPLSEYPASGQLTENEAALALGISRRALQAYRLRGGGPKFQTFGKAHKYKAGDLRDWQAANRKS
ncbi:MAG: helix-turn-helix domain-containing protein [Alphaproteobacteria bacterium]|nr:helix-turn-helix domain-containing protein [Alphaproteobacteria bacterium]